MTADPAVQAAAEAMARGWDALGLYGLAEVAVAAARPHIEAQVRAEGAAAIRAQYVDMWRSAREDVDRAFAQGLNRAATIVAERGRP